MPYTQSQLHCLKGMGIVPWVSRNVAEADEAVHALVDVVAQSEEAVQTSQAPPSVPKAAALAAESMEFASTEQPSTVGHSDFMQTPLVEIPFRGQRCTQLGKSAAPLLILVESVSTQQKQYPFEPADAKIFEDMLRAIAWRRQDVCLAVLPPASDSLLPVVDGVPCVSDVCKPHRDAVLLFKTQLPDSLDPDELIVPLAREGMMAWQLPHPALLRESPARKRQAWNVLKAARSRLL